ncbi:LysE family translocator [Halomonas sp. A11-A]|jgi:threonine/homoserine/homoserine lactone efflux protein|uniref:LysE family translocator n=1 Tax=Halomonas sp. A11-A TaxID=2183985 RepID=UPI000D9115CF|nr:LysE family translocator [Halomonas sp. A11-A]PWV74879.1 threonine/homoserine/homoserine lactone efflux protein [Halomonas sp. A11-A]
MLPSYELLIAFFSAAILFAYMPGPAMLYTAAQTIARGRHSGWMAALGIHIGGYAHVVAAALGLAALFQAIPTLYALVKLLGAGYLIWLGIRLLLSQERLTTSVADIDMASTRRPFWESIIVEVLNPKTALFFLAFLPQFIDTAGALPIWAQLLLLGTIVNLIFSSADILCVLLADKVARVLKSSRAAGNLTRRLGGGLLVTLGINLAVSRQ